MQIITNNVPRDTIDAWELTATERAEFDYLDWAAIDEGRDSATFFRYKGELNDLGEFSRNWGISSDSGLPDSLAGWDGFRSDSFFSGTLVRWADDSGESIIVGRFYT